MGDVKAALVIGKSTSSDDYDELKLVDLLSIQPIAPLTYVIQTSPFPDDSIKDGAGNIIPLSVLYNMIKDSIESSPSCSPVK